MRRTSARIALSGVLLAALGAAPAARSAEIREIEAVGTVPLGKDTAAAGANPGSDRAPTNMHARWPTIWLASANRSSATARADLLRRFRFSSGITQSA